MPCLFLIDFFWTEIAKIQTSLLKGNVISQLTTTKKWVWMGNYVTNGRGAEEGKVAQEEGKVRRRGGGPHRRMGIKGRLGAGREG